MGTHLVEVDLEASAAGANTTIAETATQIATTSVLGLRAIRTVSAAYRPHLRDCCAAHRGAYA
ncbi:MAG TPA: hypothetical protein VH061_01800 [Solirubrobacteraceae bacterium]|nr:hypothetical protein [Solirubrobacteraceae bacterium]